MVHDPQFLGSFGPQGAVVFAMARGSKGLLVLLHAAWSINIKFLMELQGINTARIVTPLSFGKERGSARGVAVGKTVA